jgi:DNA-binding response OmpR family regulator
MAASGAVNCLVLDLHMPILSGLEVYLRLKEAGRQIPTILVTGFAEEESDAISRLMPLTSGLLVKPFNPSDLVSAIEATAGEKA